MVLQDLLNRVGELRDQAARARVEAERDRRARRQENDRYVNGGVNWDGYGLETLIGMVAQQASPNQLDSLAGEWRRHGSSIAQASTDLQRSLDTLMNYWTGASATDASQVVTTNARWVSELGDTAQQMAAPIQDAGGALRSAQSSMPGKPHDNWWVGAGGGAAAGFMVGGPIGAAFGAAIGGIASAFGFGTNKKKLKREAVQTMQRYETALLGVDQTTPQFGLPSNGVNPGGDPLRNPGTGVGTPGGPPNPPGGTGPILNPGGPVGSPRDFNWPTTPSLADDPGGRWRGVTGFPGTGSVPNGEFTPARPGLGGGGLGGLPGMFPGGRGGGGGMVPPGGTRGQGTRTGGPGGRGTGRGAGRGGGFPGGLGGRGAGQDSEGRARRGTGAGRPPGARGGLSEEEAARRRAGMSEEEARRARGRGGYGPGGLGATLSEEEAARRRAGRGYGPGGLGSGGLSEEEEAARRRAGYGSGGAGGLSEEETARRRAGYGSGLGSGIGEEEAGRGRGRFGRGGALDPHGAGGFGGPGGAGARGEEDEEHQRRFPIEEDPFSSADLKAAPPVIGL